MFLLSHVMKIIAFSLPIKACPAVPWHFKRIWFFIILLAIPAILASKMILSHQNPVLVVGVVIYSLVILAMGWRAYARIGYPAESSVSQWLAFIGALIFISSDSVLSYNKFYGTIPYSEFIVLNTYW